MPLKRTWKNLHKQLYLKQRKSLINDFSFHLKNIEKEGQMKPNTENKDKYRYQ